MDNNSRQALRALICYECYLADDLALQCNNLPRDQAGIIANFEALSQEDQTRVSKAAYKAPKWLLNQKIGDSGRTPAHFEERSLIPVKDVAPVVGPNKGPAIGFVYPQVPSGPNN